MKYYNIFITLFLMCITLNIASAKEKTELISKRSINSKIFKLPDNNRELLISSTPLHYLDKTGEYQDILLNWNYANQMYFNNNNLIASKISNQGIEFSDIKTGEIIKMGKILINNHLLNITNITLENIKSARIDLSPNAQMNTKLIPGGLRLQLSLNEIQTIKGNLNVSLVFSSLKNKIRINQKSNHNLILNEFLNIDILNIHQNEQIIPSEFVIKSEEDNITKLNISLSNIKSNSGNIFIEVDIQRTINLPTNTNGYSIDENFNGVTGFIGVRSLDKARYYEWWIIAESKMPEGATVISATHEIEIDPNENSNTNVKIVSVVPNAVGAANEDIYGYIGNGSEYDTFNPSQISGSTYSKPYTGGIFCSNIESSWAAIGRYYTFPIGAKLSDESSGHEVEFDGISRLSITYTAPQNVTVQNEFGGGDVIVDAQTQASPVNMLKLINETINISAIDEQDYEDYIRLFDYWEIPVGDPIYNLTFSDGPFTNNNQKTYTAWFDRQFDITVNYDLLNGGNTNPDLYGAREDNPIDIYVQPKTVTVNNVEIDYRFSKRWDGNTVNPRTFYPPDHSQYSATYKGHRVSSSSVATASGGSRKVWSNEYFDPYDPIQPNNPGHCVVYEDNGDIYITRYVVSSVTPGDCYWEDEQLLSDGSGTSLYPSIDGKYVWSGQVLTSPCIHIVWQQYNSNTNNYEIKHAVSDGGGSEGTWESPHAPYIGISTSPEAKPVIGGFDIPSYAVVWNSGSGIYYWAEGGYSPVLISQNSSLCKNPTISTGGRRYFFIPVSIAWEMSGDIFYKDFEFIDDPVTAPIENITGSYESLSNCQQPSLASHNSGEIMLTWQGRTGTVAEKTIHSIEGSSPPPVSMKYDPIFARKKSYFESEWGTLKEIMYSNYKQITPSVGSNVLGDFSVLWKVQDQDMIAKLDYISGGGWNLESEIDIFESTGCNNPSISTASNVFSAIWSEYNSSPYRIHHEELGYPTENESTKSNHNRVYRKSLLDLSKLNEKLTGYVSVTIGEISDLNNNLLVRFKPDSTASGSFMSSPVFNLGSSSSTVKFNFGIYGEGLNIDNINSLPDIELFRVVLKSSKHNFINVLRTFRLKDLIPDSTGTFFDWKEIELSLGRFIGVDSRIELELLPNSTIKYKPSFVEVFYFETDKLPKKLDLSENTLAINSEKPELIITKFSLHPAFPNPFNPMTKISYDIPEPSTVQLKVYDLQGRLIKELFNGHKDIGRYTVQFDGSNLSSGTYFYEMTAIGNSSGKTFKEIKKLMLLK